MGKKSHEGSGSSPTSSSATCSACRWFLGSRVGGQLLAKLPVLRRVLHGKRAEETAQPAEKLPALARRLFLLLFDTRRVEGHASPAEMSRSFSVCFPLFSRSTDGAALDPSFLCLWAATSPSHHFRLARASPLVAAED